MSFGFSAMNSRDDQLVEPSIGALVDLSQEEPQPAQPAEQKRAHITAKPTNFKSNQITNQTILTMSKNINTSNL